MGSTTRKSRKESQVCICNCRTLIRESKISPAGTTLLRSRRLTQVKLRHRVAKEGFASWILALVEFRHGFFELVPAAAARWRPVEKNSAGGSSWGYIWGKRGAILAHWKAINTYVHPRNESSGRNLKS